MPIKEFYKIINLTSEDKGINAIIKLNPNHDIYKGHFSEQAVVPGVIQLQIVKEIMENHLEKKLFMGSISQVKYLIPITPLENPELSIAITLKNDETENIKTNVLVSFGDAVFTKAKITFSIAK